MDHQTTKTDLNSEYETLKKNYKSTIRKRSLFIIGGLLILFTILTATIVTVLKKSDAHKAAENYISANPEAQAASGGIKDFGPLPTGSIETKNGYGTADLNISVNGKKHDLDVFVHLEKEPEMEWQVLEMKIEE